MPPTISILKQFRQRVCKIIKIPERTKANQQSEAVDILELDDPNADGPREILLGHTRAVEAGQTGYSGCGRIHIIN